MLLPGIEKIKRVLLVTKTGFDRQANSIILGNGRQRLEEDGAEAAQFIDRWTRDGDLILIKGSRSMRMEQLTDKLRELGE